jgi:hypothetical protein
MHVACVSAKIVGGTVAKNKEYGTPSILLDFLSTKTWLGMYPHLIKAFQNFTLFSFSVCNLGHQN